MNTERGAPDNKISLELFEKLIDSHQQELLKHAFFMIGSLHDAEDIIQESFIKFFQQSSKLQDQKKARAYLFRIVTNTCIDLMRSRKGKDTISLENISNLTDHQGNGSKQTHDLQEEFNRISALLKQIPEQQSSVIRMRTVNDLSFIDIADIQGLPVSTVKSRFKYGIDKLRQKSGIKKEVKNDL